MKDTTRATIVQMAVKNSFTFYAPVAIALNVKGRTAEKYLRALEAEGVLVSKDDGIHAVTFELSRDAQAQYEGRQAFARAVAAT